MDDTPPAVGHTDSIDSRDSGSGKPAKKEKNRRPANTAFRQQRLKAWQPILTPKTVLPIFFAIGIIFAPIGGLLLYASSQVQELKIDYTKCYVDAPEDNLGPMDTKYVTASFKSNNSNINAQWKRSVNISHTYNNFEVTNLTSCTLEFRIPEDMTPPVLFYYHLTNFYQNHRKYVNSFYDKQLKGDAVSKADIDASNCYPLAEDSITKKAIYPCGLIANSMFNDTFMQPVMVSTINSSASNQTYNMTEKGIAWASDKELYKRYNDNVKANNWTFTVPPPNWQSQWPGGVYSDDHPAVDIGEDEHFIVWMRTAGLPSFSKLYMRNDNETMRQGTYSLEIISNFPTDVYQGTKSIVITTRTVMGGKNPFLGIAYVVVGGICIVLGAVFAVTHLIKPRKLGDHTYLSWNNAPAAKTGSGGPSIGISTGREVA